MKLLSHIRESNFIYSHIRERVTSFELRLKQINGTYAECQKTLGTTALLKTNCQRNPVRNTYLDTN